MKGVTSDIVLPDQLEYLKVREKDDPDALPWDEINKSPYASWNSGYDLKTIQQLSNQRVENDPAFKLIRENTDWLAKQNDKGNSLKLDKYQAEQKRIRSTFTQIQSLTKLNNEINAGLASGSIQARIVVLGGAVFASSPTAFGRFLVEETEKWGTVVKLSGAKPE